IELRDTGVNLGLCGATLVTNHTASFFAQTRDDYGLFFAFFIRFSGEESNGSEGIRGLIVAGSASNGAADGGGLIYCTGLRTIATQKIDIAHTTVARGA